MINNDKFNYNTALGQIAGVMPNDSNIEFNGVKKSKEVLWLQNGTNHYFADLPIEYLQLIKTTYLKFPKAVAFLKAVTNSFPRQLELFTYYMWGSLDGTPDIENGVLSDSENFRDNPNCLSLLWNCKNITIDGHILTQREIFITDMIYQDMKDVAMARLLCISISYLNDVKKALFIKAGVQTKTAYLKKAIQQQIV